MIKCSTSKNVQIKSSKEFQLFATNDFFRFHCSKYSYESTLTFIAENIYFIFINNIFTRSHCRGFPFGLVDVGKRMDDPSESI